MDCATPRHADQPAAAEPHAALCASCRTRLTRDLRHLPALHAELGTILVTTPIQPGGRGHGDGLPYNQAASETRDQIHHDLTWWAHHITEDRRTQLTITGVPALAGFIRGTIRWARFRPWAGDLAATINDNRAAATTILDPYITRRFPIPGHHCPACTSGILTVTVYATDGDKRRSHVTCQDCGQIWAPEQWFRLGQQLLAA